jgi:hypothetical protein
MNEAATLGTRLEGGNSARGLDATPNSSRERAGIGWVPLAVLPLACMAFRSLLIPWVFMCFLPERAHFSERICGADRRRILQNTRPLRARSRNWRLEARASCPDCRQRICALRAPGGAPGPDFKLHALGFL